MTLDECKENAAGIVETAFSRGYALGAFAAVNSLEKRLSKIKGEDKNFNFALEVLRAVREDLATKDHMMPPTEPQV